MKGAVSVTLIRTSSRWTDGFGDRPGMQDSALGNEGIGR
jgi:hypothetical protein